MGNIITQHFQVQTHIIPYHPISISSMENCYPLDFPILSILYMYIHMNFYRSQLRLEGRGGTAVFAHEGRGLHRDRLGHPTGVGATWAEG